MSLDTNAQAAHDCMISLSQHLAELTTQINNAIPFLQGVGANDSAAKVQALKDAMAEAAKTVQDTAATYTEVGSL